jgi:hypothetical protein
MTDNWNQRQTDTLLGDTQAADTFVTLGDSMVTTHFDKVI